MPVKQQQPRRITKAIEIRGRADDIGKKNGLLRFIPAKFFVDLRASLK